MQNNNFNASSYYYEERMKLELAKMGTLWDEKKEVDVLVSETDFVKLYKYWNKKIRKLINEIREEYKNNWKKIYDEKIEKEMVYSKTLKHKDCGCFSIVQKRIFDDYSLYVYCLLKAVDALEQAIDLLQDEKYYYNIFKYNESEKSMEKAKLNLSGAIDVYEQVKERFKHVKDVIIKRLEKIIRGNLTDEELLKLEETDWEQI